MAYEDYSKEEIRTICYELIFIHADKLKQTECTFVNRMYHKCLDEKLDGEERDILIGMYDRMGEGGY